MKKNIFMYGIFILVMTLFTSKVSALEYINEKYVNAYGIEITEKQKENLENLGFTELEIETMDQEEFDNNKDLNAMLVAQTDKYYKTIVIYPSEISTYSLNKNLLSTTTEISKEEYENSDENLISPLANTNGYTETNYKKMTTTIAKVNNSYFRYKNTLVWKKLPATRSYDIIGIGIDSTVSGVSSSKYYRTTAEIDDSAQQVCTFATYSSVQAWELSGSGYAATFKVPSDTTTRKVTSLSTEMYFNVQKLTNTTIKTLNAYGDYKHAQLTVDASVGAGVSIGTGGISFDASVSASIVEKFDSMSTAQATWTGTW